MIIAEFVPILKILKLTSDTLTSNDTTDHFAAGLAKMYKGLCKNWTFRQRFSWIIASDQDSQIKILRTVDEEFLRRHQGWVQ
ncbi:hypothetical protein [Desulforhopalus sp. IMCC35007]|uniref:hypothetical protein n=1 Tax=Desulforhopalus sp. IMCC35007 TaxID=2569543 RepID=UPI0010ADF15B|nr:hypothetical protein [Desulforhopalus sp. IMCC35007]TKB11326.1 hypothetical protein FCL48_04775 [Desulforhopalus sp. IMCC35007]